MSDEQKATPWHWLKTDKRMQDIVNRMRPEDRQYLSDWLSGCWDQAQEAESLIADVKSRIARLGCYIEDAE